MRRVAAPLTHPAKGLTGPLTATYRGILGLHYHGVKNSTVGSCQASEQAYVPAQQPATQQDPWLPPADAHSGRARHPLRASAQGPQPALRLSSAFASTVLARSLRLRSAEDFRQTTRQGRRCSTYTVVVHALFDDSPPPPRVGIAVNKAVGIAVQRNRVKRRLRAVMATRITSLPGGRVVIRALPPSAKAGFASLAGDVDRCVNRLTAAAA